VDHQSDTSKVIRPDLLDFLLLKSGGSFLEKIVQFMHKCKRSKCAVCVEICELLSGGNIRKLNVNKQFSETSIKVNTEDNKHCYQVQLAFFLFHFFFLPATRVCFVIKLARATENQVGLALTSTVFKPKTTVAKNLNSFAHNYLLSFD